MRILIGLMLFVTTLCKAEIVRYEYYGDFPFWESPLQLFKGQNPLTKAQAMKSVHVQVGFDKLNRIIDIQARQGKSFKPFYRGFGSLYVYAAHTKVTYGTNHAKLTFFNGQGAQIKVNGEVWTMQYSMDERKRFTQLSFLNKDDNIIENRFGYANYQWQHLDDGSVIETRFNLKGEIKPHRPGFEFERIRLVYDADGHLTLMQNIDEDGQLVASKSGAAQYRYFYNSIGGFDRWEVYDTKGKPALGPTGTSGEQYTFDDKGWIKIAFFNQQGKPGYHASGAVNWHAKYDNYGNMLARWFTDEDEKNINGRYGFHKVKYVYDKKGMHQVRQEFYSPDDKLINTIDGVAKVHFKRDKYGNLLEQKHTDTSGKLVMDTWRKYAVATYQYDDSGVQTGVDKFDESGNKLSD